jgi:hypothetical protein
VRCVGLELVPAAGLDRLGSGDERRGDPERGGQREREQSSGT